MNVLMIIIIFVNIIDIMIFILIIIIYTSINLHRFQLWHIYNYYKATAKSTRQCFFCFSQLIVQFWKHAITTSF